MQYFTADGLRKRLLFRLIPIPRLVLFFFFLLYGLRRFFLSGGEGDVSADELYTPSLISPRRETETEFYRVRLFQMSTSARGRRRLKINFAPHKSTSFGRLSTSEQPVPENFPFSQDKLYRRPLRGRVNVRQGAGASFFLRIGFVTVSYRPCRRGCVKSEIEIFLGC